MDDFFGPRTTTTTPTTNYETYNGYNIPVNIYSMDPTVKFPNIYAIDPSFKAPTRTSLKPKTTTTTTNGTQDPILSLKITPPTPPPPTMDSRKDETRSPLNATAPYLDTLLESWDRLPITTIPTPVTYPSPPISPNNNEQKEEKKEENNDLLGIEENQIQSEMNVKRKDENEVVLKPTAVPILGIHGGLIEDCPKLKEEMNDPIGQLNLRLFNLHVRDLFDQTPIPSSVQQPFPPDIAQLDFHSVAKVLPKARIALRVLDEKSLASPYHAAIGLQISLRKLENWQFSVDYILNGEAERLFGYTREECISHVTDHHRQFISRLISREDWQKVSKVQDDTWTDGAPGFRLTVTCINKKQTKFKCLLDARVELYYEVNNPDDIPAYKEAAFLSKIPRPPPPNIPITVDEPIKNRIQDKGENLYSKWVAVKRVIFFFIPLPSEQTKT